MYIFLDTLAPYSFRFDMIDNNISKRLCYTVLVEISDTTYAVLKII